MRLFDRLVVFTALVATFLSAGTAVAFAETVGTPVLADEFSAAPLNANDWLKTTPYASHDDVYAQRYTDSNLSFVNGGLRLQTRKETVHDGGRTWAYSSGTITTGSRVDYGGTVKHAFSYGYFEMRAKLPKGQGIWPAFWMTNDDPDPAKHHEIDGFEVLGHEPNKVYMTYHRSDRQVYQSVYVGPDFSAGYHTFGVDWQPGYIRWYIDGVLRGEYKGTIFSNELWVIADTMVGTEGSWPGTPDATTVFPQNYDIDYIRVYRTMADAAPAPANAAPVPTGDAYVAQQDKALTVAAPGVLRNDWDPNGDVLTASVFAGASHGVVAMRADGSFIYTPAPGFSGTDTFMYRAWDGAGFSSPVSVSMTVQPTVRGRRRLHAGSLSNLSRTAYVSLHR